MLEYLLLAVALIGTAAAGYIDLKTTEIPDYIPLFIGGSGLLIHLLYGLITGSWIGLQYSLGIGFGFLALGYIMFYTGQWGEADVLVLGALGFLIPLPLSIFHPSMINVYYPLIFILNVFLIGGIYSIIYAIVKTFMTKGVFTKFYNKVLTSKKGFLVITIAYFAIFPTIVYLITKGLGFNPVFWLIIKQGVYFYPTILAVYILYIFTKILDSEAFRWTISTKDLQEGDVLAEDITYRGKKISSKLLVGLDAETIKILQKARKKVVIKGGICYAPTFFFTIIATVYLGNVILYFVF
ncbi:MAG: prepilin peptidase [DPANN group archaeon]|nr:prepilin peptidase [DPANN group archaeon]